MACQAVLVKEAKGRHKKHVWAGGSKGRSVFATVAMFRVQWGNGLGLSFWGLSTTIEADVACWGNAGGRGHQCTLPRADGMSRISRLAHAPQSIEG